MAEDKSGDTQNTLSEANNKILKNLEDRNILLKKARKNELKLSAGAAVVLQAQNSKVATEETDDKVAAKDHHNETPDKILEAVEYRLAITDLFVEKAQYHLEDRAGRYKKLGYGLYVLAILMFCIGATFACYKMFHPEKGSTLAAQQSLNLPKQEAATSSKPVVLVLNQTSSPGQWAAAQVPITASTQPTSNKPQSPPVDPSLQAPPQKTWIDLFQNFIVNFTAYGFLVLTGVILTRGARACLDQRERLLAKRHSLRQGRLFLHLSGGRVTINDMERAFNWNHEQQNAFTNMPTDAKAPWGNVVDEIIKIVPELVKTGVAAAEKKNAPGGKG